jgi:hypothetical protein
LNSSASAPRVPKFSRNLKRGTCAVLLLGVSVLIAGGCVSTESGNPEATPFPMQSHPGPPTASTTVPAPSTALASSAPTASIPPSATEAPTATEVPTASVPPSASLTTIPDAGPPPTAQDQPCSAQGAELDCGVDCDRDRVAATGGAPNSDPPPSGQCPEASFDAGTH